MKRLLLSLMILLGISGGITPAFGSHGMGGEITWTCLANGQYKFRLKFYRDCNGITPSNTLQMVTNHPIGSITMNLVQQNDISPNGFQSNGVTQCFDCSAGNFGSPIPGLVEEYVYESGNVTLAGVPPVTGWYFRWGECCRSSALSNLVGGGGQGFANRAYMFPYNGQNANPCFDSSPYFSEKPSTIICTGFPFKYNPAAVDPELDSLVYGWANPIDDSGNNLAFAPGYNVNSQLPSATQNPNNVGATINSQTGEMSYTSFTGGYFVTVVKVTAYKCGIKVAEIYREINVVLNNNCPPVLGGLSNTPPEVNAPFFDPVTGLQTAYSDTFYAGDTVNFFLNATDFEFYTNGTGQLITIEAYGNEFGVPVTNASAGCPITPCATLSTNTPFSFLIGGGVGFNWRLTCDHVKGLDTVCTRISNTYRFVIKASDNYCPANASNVSTINITVLAPPKLEAPKLRCASVNPDGSVSLSWNKPTERDSQNIFHAYEIYAAQAAGGPYVKVDSVLAWNTLSFTHTAASLNALFGTNAQQQSIWYYLKTRSGCDGDSISLASDTLRTIKLNAVQNASLSIDLTWNALHTPPLSSHATKKYKIYRQYPIPSAWVLIDSTNINTLTYTDPFGQQICDDFIAYRVDLPDSSGCVSMSSIDTVHAVNPSPIVAISPANPVICSGTSTTLSATPGAVSYLWNTGAVTQAISVSNPGTYTVTANYGACQADTSVTLVVVPLPTPTVTGLTSACGCVTVNAGAGYAGYLWSNGAVTQTTQLCASGTYTVTVTNANGCTGTDTHSFTLNPSPAPVITGTAAICAGTTTTFNAGAFTSWQWNTGAITQTISPGTAGNYTVTVTNAFGCTGTDTQLLTVNPNPVPNITGTTAICAGSNTVFNAGGPYPGYQWNTGAVTPTINISAAGTYTVTVTDANGCTGTDNQLLTVNTNPIPNITGTNAICLGQNTTWDAGAYSSYVWNTGATTQTVSLNTAGTYTVTVTDANGCTGTDTYSLVVNSLPTPNITGTNVICAGQNTTFNAGAYSGYSWNTGATTQTISIGTAGTYTVTVTDGNGCTASDTYSLTVNPNPVPNITGDNSICAGTTTVFDAGAYTSYSWNTGAVTQTITTGTANTYTVTVTDANGCTGTDTYTLTVNANPVPVITGTNVICDLQTTTFDAGAYTLYSWNTGATTQTINIGTAGTYTVTVTDANGCVGTDTYALTVNANPVPNITGNNVVCSGFNTTFNAGGYSGYSWNTGATTQTISVGTAGTYTVTVTNANGCTGTDTYALTVNPNPVPNITGDNSICAGFTTVFDAGTYTSYVWNTGAVSQTITTGTANTYTVTVTDANGCTGTDTYTLTVNANPVPNITGTNVICDQQTTTFDAGAYSLYNWNTGATTQTINIGTAGTYTVTVTDVNGCIGTDTYNLTVNLLPSATISGNQSICDGNATTFNITFAGPGPYAYTYSDGSSSYGPFNTASGSATINVSPNVNTNYTMVSVVNTNTLCVGTISGTATVSVTPLPTAQITGTTDICIGSSTNLQIAFTGVGPWTYTYNQNGVSVGPFTTSNNPEIISVTPGASTTYGLTPTVTGAGCPGATNPATAVVTVNVLPTVSLTGNNTICAGDNTNLTLNFTGTGPYTYSYSNGTTTFGPFTTSNDPETVVVTPGSTTTYTPVTISDANCTGTVAGSAAITVNPLPTATLSGTTSICDGTDTDLIINFTGTGPFTYSYSDGSTTFGPFTTNANPVSVNVSPTLSTNYNPISISDANCTGSVAGSAAITVIPLPTATITGTTAICAGSGTNLNVTFTGLPPFEYKYTDGTTIFGPFTTNNLNISIPVSPALTTSYSLTQVTGNGCGGSYSGVADITVNAIPDAAIALSGDPELCFGENSEFSISFTGVGPFTYTYTDGSTNFGPIVATGNPEVIAVTPGVTTSYSLINISDANCPGTISGSAQVVVHPLPTADATANLAICNGSSTTFSINFTGTGPYTYSYTDAGVTQGPFTTSNNPEIITVNPSVNTNYAVTTIADAYCTGTATGAVNVTVNEIPTASISGDAEICAGESTPLTILFTGNAPFNYVYTNGINNFGPVTSNNATASFPVTPPASGTYTLVSLTDANCPGTLSGSAAILVNPLPQPVISGDLSICDGETSTLSATAGFVSYSWSNGAASTGITTGVGGPYTVTVIDANGCSGTSPSATLVVNMVPVVSFTNDTSYSCETTSINFTNTSAYPAGSQFLWNFGDGSTSTLENPSHVYADSGVYQVSLYITTSATCFNDTTQTVEAFFFPLPVADFSADPWRTEVFNAKVLFTDLSENAVSWNWDFGDGDKSADQNPTHYFGDVGEFKVKLTVTNVTGCVDVITKEVVINPFYIPNAFTPNGDGNNEYFFDANTMAGGYDLDVQSFKITIFNRWGQSVYEADTYTKYWDGTDPDGNKVPEGVYVYKIEVTTKNSKKHLFNGTVTLLR